LVELAGNPIDEGQVAELFLWWDSGGGCRAPCGLVNIVQAICDLTGTDLSSRQAMLCPPTPDSDFFRGNALEVDASTVASPQPKGCPTSRAARAALNDSYRIPKTPTFGKATGCATQSKSSMEGGIFGGGAWATEATQQSQRVIHRADRPPTSPLQQIPRTPSARRPDSDIFGGGRYALEASGVAMPTPTVTRIANGLSQSLQISAAGSQQDNCSHVGRDAAAGIDLGTVIPPRGGPSTPRCSVDQMNQCSVRGGVFGATSPAASDASTPCMSKHQMNQPSLPGGIFGAPIRNPHKKNRADPNASSIHGGIFGS